MIEVGAYAPWFEAPTHTLPSGFAFSVSGGRHVVLIFLPRAEDRATEMIGRIRAEQALFRDEALVGFFVTSDQARYDAGSEGRGLRWLLDRNDVIARGYGAMTAEGVESGQFALIDPSLRLQAWSGEPDDDDAFFHRLRSLPSPDDHAGTPLTAPVLIAPRLFDLDLCRRLIDHYETSGGAVSGVMREVDGQTRPFVDDFKRRRDCEVQDPDLLNEIRHAVSLRLLPQIRRAFQFSVTRCERFLVACYDSAEGGYFKPHRDNTTGGTRHRRFACSINLNAEDFTGGDLCFPEYGSRTYRPPTGGGVVFSCALLHEATPVTQGKRYAFLPFLYDEEGERIRQEYLSGLQT